MNESQFIETFLRANAAYVREKYADRGALTVSSKRDVNDLLTEVDLTMQKRAVEQIQAQFPGDRIVAEEGEFAVYPPNFSGRCWVMDPIDGTNNFVRGLFPIFAVSLAFAMQGLPVAAGVYLPGLDTYLLAERHRGATRNGRALRVSTVQSLGEARVDVDFSAVAQRGEMLSRAAGVLNSVGQMRCLGSAVASICQVATGDADGYLHVELSPWDYAAAQLIVEEAGGMTSRLDGSPLHLFDGKRGILVSNGALHQALLDQITAPA